MRLPGAIDSIAGAPTYGIAKLREAAARRSDDEYRAAQQRARNSQCHDIPPVRHRTSTGGSSDHRTPKGAKYPGWPSLPDRVAYFGQYLTDGYWSLFKPVVPFENKSGPI